MYSNIYIVLATPNPVNGVIYQRTAVEVTAKSWSDAYSQVRALGYTPFIDEYKPRP